MKAINVTMMISMVLLLAGATFSAESQATNPRPFIGIQLDTAVLPELLTKHLGLSIGQGIRILNVQRNSAADQAGLERDDIIVGFQGQVVDDNEKFVEDVQKAGVGAEVSLEIIHLGQRKTVNLALKALQDEVEWKYPSEPQIEQLWQPGRIFRLGPQGQQWVEVLMDDISRQIYTYVYFINGERCVIVVEGSADDEDSTITIYVGGQTYSTTVKELDNLPEQYRQVAERALQNARQSISTRGFFFGDPQQESALTKYRDYILQKVRPNLDNLQQQTDQISERLYEKFQEQMSQLQKQIKELEKSQEELRDRLSEQWKEWKSQGQQGSVL